MVINIYNRYFSHSRVGCCAYCRVALLQEVKFWELKERGLQLDSIGKRTDAMGRLLAVLALEEMRIECDMLRAVLGV